jgi:hypothetical protein
VATKDVVVAAETPSFLVTEMQPSEVREILAGALGAGEALSARDLERVRLPAGGGTSWELDTLNGTQPFKTIRCVVIAQRQVRVYWKESFESSGGKKQPDCFSDDVIQGIGDPGIECALCPNSQFGTGKGNSQACQLKRMLFFVREDQLIPSYLALPPTSQALGKAYLLKLASMRLMPWDVVTEIGLERAQSEAGIAYSRVTFQRATNLSDEQRVAMRAYADAIRPSLLQTRLAATDVEGQVDHDDRTGHGTPDVTDKAPVEDF